MAAIFSTECGRARLPILTLSSRILPTAEPKGKGQIPYFHANRKAAPILGAAAMIIASNGACYLSSNVPMARTAPQAKNSTISAVSTTVETSRFIIRTSS